MQFYSGPLMHFLSGVDIGRRGWRRGERAELPERPMRRRGLGAVASTDEQSLVIAIGFTDQTERCYGQNSIWLDRPSQPSGGDFRHHLHQNLDKYPEVCPKNCQLWQ